MPRKTLNILQAGRALAALAVVFHHASGPARETGQMSIATIGAHGYLGVDFFFVLSGFIIYYISADKQPGSEWVSEYFRSRFVRIFVPYLPVGIGMALLYMVFPAFSHTARQWDWFATVTLLPGAHDTALIVAWTLRHELVFYAIFALAFILRSPFVGVGTWAAFTVAVNAIGTPTGAADYVFGLVNVEFLFGMVAAWAVISGRLNRTILPGFVALAAYLAFGAAPELRILFALALALWLVPLVRLEISGRLKIAGGVVLLGDASYSIYLVHLPVAVLIGRIFGGAPAAIPLGAACGVGAGLLYYAAWERPMLHLLNHRSRRADILRGPVRVQDVR
jgi:exopolysaccharide production protein ExoZ